jgi:hypothetical protein
MKNNSINFPAIGSVYEVNFGGEFIFLLEFHSETSMTSTSLAGVKKGIGETFNVTINPICKGIFMVSWQEASGVTVVHIEDYEQGIAYTNITLPDATFIRLRGTLRKINPKIT